MDVDNVNPGSFKRFDSVRADPWPVFGLCSHAFLQADASSRWIYMLSVSRRTESKLQSSMGQLGSESPLLTGRHKLGPHCSCKSQTRRVPRHKTGSCLSLLQGTQSRFDTYLITFSVCTIINRDNQAEIRKLHMRRTKSQTLDPASRFIGHVVVVYARWRMWPRYSFA